MAGADRLTTPLEGTPARPWDPTVPVPAPLELLRCDVRSAWVDYNGHMSESCYLLVIGDAADAFFRFVGIDEAYRTAGHSLYTVETHLHHHREVAEGEPIVVALQLLGHDVKRVHVLLQMRHGGSGDLLASAEQMLLHVDMSAGRAADMGEDLQCRLAAVAAAHADLSRPELVGRPMRLPDRRSHPGGRE